MAYFFIEHDRAEISSEQVLISMTPWAGPPPVLFSFVSHQPSLAHSQKPLLSYISFSSI